MNNFLFTFPNLFHLHFAHLVLEMSIELSWLESNIMLPSFFL